MGFVARAAAIGIVAGTLCAPLSARAQSATTLPPTRADFLLEEGRWAEAESEFYRQSERAPKDPVARAALGRFIAMKGAVRPGSVLVEEARKFGLDPRVAHELLVTMRSILEWRAAGAELKRDTTVAIHESPDPAVLFRMPLPRTNHEGRILGSGSASEMVWHDVVDRPIGLDSVNEHGHPIGFEIFEVFAPSVDVREGELTLHVNSRSALSATGRRYQVLRWTDGVRVLVDGRAMSIREAISHLGPDWWQLDLVHGVLVVR